MRLWYARGGGGAQTCGCLSGMSVRVRDVYVWGKGVGDYINIRQRVEGEIRGPEQ